MLLMLLEHNKTPNTTSSVEFDGVCITCGIIRECCLVVGNDTVEQDDVVIWWMEYELFDIDFRSPHRDRFRTQSSLMHRAT